MQGEQPSTVSSSPSTLLAPSAHARRALVMPYPCDRSDSAVRAQGKAFTFTGAGRVIHCPSTHKASPFERQPSCRNRMRCPRARRSLYIYGAGRVIHCPSAHKLSPFERPPSCGKRMRRPRTKRTVYIYGAGCAAHRPSSRNAKLPECTNLAFSGIVRAQREPPRRNALSRRASGHLAAPPLQVV